MKVALTKQQLISIHSLGVGVSKDDVTPVITQIALKREGDALRAMVTDRYIVLSGLYNDVEFSDWEDEAELLIDPKALKSVVDIKKADKYGNIPVHIVKDIETGHVSAVVDLVTSVHLGSVKAIFPPVMNLFPKSEPTGAGSLNIRPDFLAKLAKVLPPEARPERERTWTFEFRTMQDAPHKPQPVYAQYSAGDGYQMEALIQPALLKR